MINEITDKKWTPMREEEIQVLLEKMGLPDSVKTDLNKMIGRDQTIASQLADLNGSVMGSIKRNEKIEKAIEIGKQAAKRAHEVVSHERREAKADRSFTGKEKRRSTQRNAADWANYITTELDHEFHFIAQGAFKTAMIEVGHEDHHDDHDHDPDHNESHKEAHRLRKLGIVEPGIFDGLGR